jgi:hypothetical protein
MKIGTDISVTLPVGAANDRDKKWVKVGINMAEIDIDGDVIGQLTQATAAVTQSIDVSSEMVYDKIQELIGERPVVKNQVETAMNEINESLGELHNIVTKLQQVMEAHLEEHSTIQPLPTKEFAEGLIGAMQEVEQEAIKQAVEEASQVDSEDDMPAPKDTPTSVPKRRGRKPGSKNKSKAVAATDAFEIPKPEIKHICQNCGEEFCSITALVTHHAEKHNRSGQLGVDINSL